MAIERISKAFKDINLSFQRHPITKDVTVLKNENAIKRSVRNIVNTIPRERFFNPTLGSDVRSSLFNFVDYGTSSVIQKQIQIAIENFEPRVDNLQINVFPRPDSNEFEVNILFDIAVSYTHLRAHET